MTYGFRLGTVSKSYRESEKDNTVYASTTNGVSASCGRTETHMKSKLSITTEEEAMDDRKLPPIHPGEILLEEFLKPFGVSQYRVAKDIGVPPRRINEIVHGRRSITADTALRLARYFGTSERFWVNLQAHYEVETEKDRLGERLDREVTVLARDGAAEC